MGAVYFQIFFSAVFFWGPFNLIEIFTVWSPVPAAANSHSFSSALCWQLSHTSCMSLGWPGSYLECGRHLFILLWHPNTAQESFTVKVKRSKFLFLLLPYYVCVSVIPLQDVKIKFTTGFISDCKRFCAIPNWQWHRAPKGDGVTPFVSHFGLVVTK